jgi:hypothetical protein
MKIDKVNILQSLNPADYFTLAMDEEIRSESMPGSLCGFCLELDSVPEITLLEAKINELSQRFPLILASLQQRGNRFYWCQRQQNEAIFFQQYCPEKEDGELFIQTQLENLLNHRQKRDEIMPLSFHLLRSKNKSVLLLRWIHPLCDAVGASLILQYLCTDDKEQRKLFNYPESESLLSLQLKKFSLWQKIKLFMKAKRYVTTLDQQQSIIHAADKKPKKLQLAAYKLSIEQTTKINQLARKQVGLMGISLYYIGCFMRALEKMNPRQTGDAYCVPYAFNLRKQRVLTPLLNNHVGVLFAQAAREQVNNRSQLFEHLKLQNKQVIRQQLDYAFLPIMWAASFLSLKKHGENLRLSYQHKTERSSFWFSNVNLSDLGKQSLCGAKIKGISNLCQISSPPAIALLTCEYQQQLSLNYNYIAPLFDPNDVEKLHQFMVEELLTP